MLPLILSSVLCENHDRRLDPFQFNPCVWAIPGFDKDPTIPEVNKTEDMEGVAKVLYSKFSTCDTIVIPGITNSSSTELLLQKVAEKNMKDFQNIDHGTPQDFAAITRIDLDAINKFGNVKYPLADSKCPTKPAEETVDFSGSFYGNVKFHDTVNTTTLFLVNLDYSTDEAGCSKREAEAREICNIINNLPANNDVFVIGAFNANKSEPYHQELANCGLKAGTSISKNIYTRVTAAGNKEIWDDIYVKGGATKWLDIAQSFKVGKAYSKQSKETSPVIVYVHQPLSNRWFKFELGFSICIMAASASFFAWVIYYSRIRQGEDGGYENLEPK